MKKIALTFLSSILILSACKKDDPVHEHEIENINQVAITFTSYEDSNTYTWSLNEVDTIRLKNDTYYDISPSFAYNDNSHHEDLTDEIRNEAENHQIIYTSTPSELMAIENLDVDANGLPFGLQAELKTLKSGTGKLRLVLKHFNGSKTNVNAGSTDVDVQFPIVIE